MEKCPRKLCNFNPKKEKEKRKRKEAGNYANFPKFSGKFVANLRARWKWEKRRSSRVRCLAGCTWEDLPAVLSCFLSSGTCCIYEVERISNGKRVSLGESSKSLSLYFLFPFLLSNPLRRYRIQKETGQRQVFPCSATEMRKTCTRISFSIHNSQDSEFESAFGTNFNDNSRRGANRKRTSQCKDIEAGHNVKMPPRFSSAYPYPLAATTHYPLPLFFSFSFFLASAARLSQLLRVYSFIINGKQEISNSIFTLLLLQKYIFHMSAVGCNYAINYST